MTVIRRGMVLAAGLGLRMRPLTDDRPKALVALQGKALLDHALARFRAAGIRQIIVNAHYRAGAMHAHLDGFSDVTVSDEAALLLDTGGGVRKALPNFGGDPFVVANCDSVWLDGSTSALGRMEAAWRDTAMDALLLLHPKESAVGYAGLGDFDLAQDGRPVRRGDRASASLVFTGVQILHPRLFEGTPDGPFSLNRIYDRAADTGRLYGIVHDGEWFHVGTPEDLARAEAIFARRGNGDVPP